MINTMLKQQSREGMLKIAILNRVVNEKVRYLQNLKKMWNKSHGPLEGQAVSQVWLKLSRGERTQRRIENS